MLFQLSILTVLLVSLSHAILNDSKPKYGVPQQAPFRKYGPPGPYITNFNSGSNSFSGSYEQIKNHYGAPKPFYGPPHNNQNNFGSPSQIYGPPLNKPLPQNLLPKPAALYGPPTFEPLPAQKLPLLQPAIQFNSPHQPATSYGPPPSGPLNIPPKQIFGPPPSDYSPPPLPNFNNKPETTVIITENHQDQQLQQQQQQQGQIQTNTVAGSQAPFHTACDGWKPIPAPIGAFVDNNHIDTQSGYSQVAQSQVHALTPSSFPTTQYSGGATASDHSGTGPTGFNSAAPVSSPDAGNYAVNGGLSEEQLVALALQQSIFDTDNVVKHQDNLLSTSPTQGLPVPNGKNFKFSNYFEGSKRNPPTEPYAPPSYHSQNFYQQSGSYSSTHGNLGISGQGQQLGPNLSPPNGQYGSPVPPNDKQRPSSLPPTGNNGYPALENGIIGPLPFQTSSSYGIPPPPKSKHRPTLLPPAGNYGPPPLESGKYGLPPLPAGGKNGPLPLPNSNFVPFPPSAFGNNYAQRIKGGKQPVNFGPISLHSGAQPSNPVAYRPPVPQKLLEGIGATVQHLDNFGVRPQFQAPTYIPPATNEIPQTGPGNLNIEYGGPHPQQNQPQNFPQNIIEQQLPQQRPGSVFHQIEQQQHQNNYQQQQFGNAHAEYGVPPPPPLDQQGQPQQFYKPPPPPEQLQQQYLPPTGPGQQSFNTANQVQGPNPIDGVFNDQHQQQQHPGSSVTYISQSIPIAEQHTHLISGPATSYGPPPSGGNELDQIGYDSKTSHVSTSQDNNGPKGCFSINILSAESSEPIFSSSQEVRNNNAYQVLSDGYSNDSTNHDDILSNDLLHTVLNTVEQQHQPLPANHKAENRADFDIPEALSEGEDNKRPDLAAEESRNVESKEISEDEKLLEMPAQVQEIKPIVVKEENEAKH